MVLWKYCTQHINKVGKLSNGHRTGKGLFSFQFQRKTMPKNVPTTIKFCSFHMLAKLCSKSLKVGYSSMWTENFWMFKLGFKETEEPVFIGNCQYSWDHRESKGVSQKHLFLLHWLCWSLCVDQNKLWKLLKEMGVPDHFTHLLRNLYADQEARVRTTHGTMDWLKIE